MATKKQPLTPDGRYVSFWIGLFPSEDALEAFIDSGSFETEQGFRIEPPLLPFHAYDDAATPTQLLAKLMREPSVLKAANKQLPSQSFNSLIRHEGFRYDPAKAPRAKKKRRMTFLGTFRLR